MLGRLLRSIGTLLSYVYSEGLNKKLRAARWSLYTGWQRKRFKHFEGMLTGHIELHDPDCITVGNKTNIQGGTRLLAWKKFHDQEFTPCINIGCESVLQRDCFLSAVDRIDIGNRVAITEHTMILDNIHGDFRDNHLTFIENPDVPDVFLKNAYTRDLSSKGPVIIGDDVHIGMYCTILPGTVIGHHSVVAAHSVVSRKIPPYSLVAGNPAEVIMTFGRKKKQKEV